MGKEDKGRRWVQVAIGLLLMALGVGCFNYTRESGLSRHTEWAEEHGLPAPSAGIRYGGYAALIVGAFAVVTGWRKRS